MYLGEKVNVFTKTKSTRCGRKSFEASILTDDSGTVAVPRQPPEDASIIPARSPPAPKTTTVPAGRVCSE